MLETSSGRTTAICRLELARSGSDLWQIQIQGDGPKVTSIKELITAQLRLKENASVPADAVLASQLQQWADVLDVLRGHGFQVEALPEGDYQFSMSLDLTSGRSISSMDGLHSFAAQNDVLAKNLSEVVNRAFTERVAALAQDIEGSLAQCDIDNAIRSIRNSRDEGILVFPPSEALFVAINKIDVSSLNPADRRFVREVRLFVSNRLGHLEIAGAEAEALLAEEKGSLTEDEIADLRLVSATATLKRGHTESGLLVLKDLLRSEGGLSAEKRGWCWRNISLALQPDATAARDAARILPMCSCRQAIRRKPQRVWYGWRTA